MSTRKIEREKKQAEFTNRWQRGQSATEIQGAMGYKSLKMVYHMARHYRRKGVLLDLRGKQRLKRRSPPPLDVGLLSDQDIAIREGVDVELVEIWRMERDLEEGGS